MKVLLVINLQNDLIDKKELTIVQAINRLVVASKFDYIVSSQKYHPATYIGFTSANQKPGDTIERMGRHYTLEAPNCLWGTEGAKLHDKFLHGKLNAIFRHGFKPNVLDYSACCDIEGNHTGLIGYLNDIKAQQVYLAGVGDCVLRTYIDLWSNNIQCSIVSDCCVGIKLGEEQTIKAQDV